MQNQLKIARNQLFSHSVIKNASFLIIGTIINGLVNFVFLIVAAKLYTPEAVGLSSAAISSIGLISLIADLGLSIAIIRFLPDSGKESNRLLNFSITFVLGASALTTIVFVVGLNIWSSSLLPIRQNALLLATFIVFALTSSLLPLLLNVFIAKRNTRYIPIINIVVSVLKIVFIVLMSFLLNSTFGILVGVGLATVIGLLLCIFWYLPKVQKGFSPIPTVRISKLRDILGYSLGNYLGRLLLQVPQMVLPLIIVNLTGAENNAVFYVSWGIVSLLSAIPSSICNSLFAEVSNDATSLRTNTIVALKFLLVLILPSTLITILIAFYLLSIFGSLYAEAGTRVLQILAVSMIPWGINYMYISIARFKKRNQDVIMVAGISSILSLVLASLLLLKMGLVGIGIGYLAGQCISVLIVVIPLRRIISKKAAQI
jgi:O-antigen/teichoic acid export membrane protein